MQEKRMGIVTALNNVFFFSIFLLEHHKDLIKQTKKSVIYTLKEAKNNNEHVYELDYSPFSI